MNDTLIPLLYKKYFVDKEDERKVMFQKIHELFNPAKGIYPGSFTHITPSFYIRDMTYVDSDKRISRFFSSQELVKFIDQQKQYKEKPIIKAFQSDFKSDLPLENLSFDIMFSFYSGFISQDCKKYLKANGILVTNNSHGDASLAYIDNDYELIYVVRRYGSNFTLSDKDLSSFFQKKDGSEIDEKIVSERMTGEKFTKKTYAYIFRKLC